jgi:hypothetical protein
MLVKPNGKHTSDSAESLDMTPAEQYRALVTQLFSSFMRVYRNFTPLAP